MKAWEHFKTITHHRHLVMKGCFAVGLYKQGLLYDLSKYSWTEFSVGAKYYQGFKSPNNAEREATGVSLAWLHHKGRNKHHLEYWIDYGIGEGEHGCMTGMEMPVKYVVEMYCDRVAACKTYQKDAYTNRSALEYYEKGKGKYMMHANTAKLLENMLTYLAEHGEAATNDYIRREILKNKK
ncbi:hypothetical protein SAMN05421493_101389 [Pseudobutyrivibrio sp. 49]|uniref:DUF5662 family protein n=1 Tax=Pseudobutyrivibrio sp. 49 TaxID=1855344 RepID=UPI000890F555|nr:DUF5662 family protein [Pseudobutyrivibrio sp. 49]SDH36197.1 hypothetical protein SAMN05421493_101389 [Pseudobutyrivibrio sp. 49]